MQEERKGELCVFSSSLLWSLLPVITVLAYSSLTPIWTVTLSSLFSLIPLSLILTTKKEWAELKKSEAYFAITMTGILNGVLFHLLYFLALTKTSVGNVTLLSQMEIFFTFLILILWRKEQFYWPHVLGGICMLFGAIAIVFDGKLIWNIGDAYILCGACIAPIGNHFNKLARTYMSTSSILFLRCCITLPPFVLLAMFVEGSAPLSSWRASLPFLLINGILIFGVAKILWVEAIHRIPISKSISLAAFSPGLTLFFAYLFLDEAPTTVQLIAFLPLVGGTLLLTRKPKQPKTLE
ncbi:MAG: DMT family transporter [Bdellovibrionales bacterium]|nr:DMT family transporter [Bdellovibrionales bacterium]